MEGSGAVFIGIIVLIAIIVTVKALSKTDEEKEIERKKKAKLLQQERQRLANIEAIKEAEREKKILIKKQRQEQLNQAGNLISKKITDAFTTTSKLISDGTHKFRKGIDQRINKHYLTSFSWVMVTSSKDHVLFTFKDNDELIITKNGNVEKGSYEMLGQNQGILITRDENTKHFNFVNLNNDYFFLNKVSTFDVYALVNHKKFADKYKQWFLNEVEKVTNELEIK